MSRPRSVDAEGVKHILAWQAQKDAIAKRYNEATDADVKRAIWAEQRKLPRAAEVAAQYGISVATLKRIAGGHEYRTAAPAAPQA